MRTWTTNDVGYAGEKAVVQALNAKGWTIDVWNSQAPGSTDIQASSGGKKILVQVKAALAPARPLSPSNDELRNIKSRAGRIGAEAWVAKVQLDSATLSPVSIDWSQLT